MITPELMDFLRAHRDAGKSHEQLKAELVAAGWQAGDVEAGLKALETGQGVPQTTGAPAGTPGKIPGIGELVSETWQIYTSRFWTLMGISLIPAVILLGLGALFGAGAVGVGLVGTRFGFDLSNPITVILGVVLLILIVIFAIYLGIWSQVAMLYGIKDHSERISIREAFSRGSHQVASFFGVSILSGLIVMAGFILLIVPGIIFALWYAFATYVLVDEKLTGTAALKRSKQYAQGQLGAIFWRFLVVGGAGGVISVILNALGGSGQDTNIAFSILSFAFSLLWAPFMTAYAFSIYRGAKAAKGTVPAPAAGGMGWAIALSVIGIVVVIGGLLASVTLLALNSARAKSRDAKRLADIRQLQSALELYFNDQGRYPASLGELAQGSAYLGTVPTAPIPPDGSCTQDQNQYRYQSGGETFTVTFCLGSQIGGFSAGVHKVTEWGINKDRGTGRSNGSSQTQREAYDRLLESLRNVASTSPQTQP